MPPTHLDVFITGAGPVGLLLAYHLTRLGLSVMLIDAEDKASPSYPMYGRACTILPRTCEMLDQLGLYDELAQTGLRMQGGFNYIGREHVSRGFMSLEELADMSYFGLGLNIRLKYIEDVLRKRLERLGVEVWAPWRLEGFRLDEAGTDDYKVDVTYLDADNQRVSIRAKYIVGCDGAHSLVRKLAGISYVGERTVDHWVRMDGVVMSNIPQARIGFGNFESPTHGHVLWVALDHGATRIGYILNDELWAKYGRDMCVEDAVFEAKRACEPWEIEFERVDWHTVYGIQQFVSDRLQDRERILLAGDAAHGHSSGSAQGMNTGIHDVVNLGWRLAGVLKGLYKPEVLAGYSPERHRSATELIENDKSISALMSNRLPGSTEEGNDTAEDPMALLDKELRRQALFTLGFGISYEANVVNDVSGSKAANSSIVPGNRVPDVMVKKPGRREAPIRLLEVMKLSSRFHVVIFTGKIEHTSDLLNDLRRTVDAHISEFAQVVEFHTIVAGEGLALDESIGTARFGDGYWDPDLAAHETFCPAVAKGVVLVVRPDGILGYASNLDGFNSVVEYLRRLMASR